MPIAYAYSRYSSPAQAKGDSARRQLEAATRFAEQHGLTLDTTLRDEGVSGYTGANRTTGALGSFLQRVEGGEIERGSYLLLDSLDRLSRQSEMQVLGILSSLTLAGVKVANVSGGYVLDNDATAFDLIRVVLDASRAHSESVEKGRKVRAAHAAGRQRARDTGAVYSKVAPHWLRLEDRKWTVVPDRVAVVQRMFSMKADGLGHAHIAAALNKEGVTTARGGIWASASVRDILRSRTVLGEYQPGKWNGKGKRRTLEEPIPGYYPRLISDELFYRVQSVIDQRRNPNAAPRSSDFKNLLVGLVTCGTCGGSVGYLQSTFPKQPNWRAAGVLRCNNHYKGTCSNKDRIPYEKLEADLLPFVATLPLARGTQRGTVGDKIARLEGECAALQSRIEVLLDQLEGGASVAERLRQREAELARLRGELERARAQAVQDRVALHAVDAQAQVATLANEMQTVTGAERYALRAKINAALARVAQAYTMQGAAILVDLDVREMGGTRAEIASKGRLMEDVSAGRRVWWRVTLPSSKAAPPSSESQVQAA